MKFFKAIGNFVAKYRFIVVALWIVAAAVVFWRAPVLSEVAKTDESGFLPADAQTMQASALFKQLFPDSGSRSSLILVLTDGAGLSDADRAYAASLESFLNGARDKYDIQDVTSPFSNKELEAAMLSADGKSAVVKVDLKTGGYEQETNDAVRALRGAVQGGGAPAVPSGLQVNITGDAPLGQEYIDSVHNSLDTTTKITILLIVVILLIIYRSPLAPVLPLATIGLSFLISRGVVALLTTVGYKVSSFTEIFLIAVLFGAGTDYCLLLISRYREELVAGLDPKAALASAFPHTSAAILSSGGTVIIGFIGMALAKFGVFNTTGPSIAIGVGVTVLSVLTLTPALIAIFGEHIFWPAHPSKNREKEARGSPFWNKLSQVVTKKPLVFLLASLAVIIPFMVLAANVTRTFDSLKELPESSDTVAGFEAIKAHFNQGEMLPVKVVLKTDRDVWDNASLQAVDNVADGILKVDGVAKVRTATRPGGEQLNEISLPRQIEALTGGLGQSGEAFDALSGGLADAQSGVGQVADGLGKGQTGLGSLSKGATDASGGLGRVGSGLGALSKSEQDAINGLGKIKTGMNAINGGLDQSKAGLKSMLTALQGVKAYLDGLAAMNPMIKMDPNYNQVYGAVQQMIANIPAMTKGMDDLKGGVGKSQNGIASAASGLKKIKGGIDESKNALTQVQSGLGALKTGSDDAAGQLGQASDSLRLIYDGLGKSLAGIDEMQSRMSDAQQEAADWASGLNGLNSVFYLPEGTLDKYPELKDYMQTYISPDGHGVTFDVILTQPPYSAEALDSISKIGDAVAFSLKNGPLQGAEYHVGGSTAAYSDLRQITQDDFIKVMAFVLLGIFVVLAILLRSITAPVYLIVTIVVSYLTTLGITWLVFQAGLGREGLSWSVPFFSFCLLVALGVDYNIFLMSRVKEEYRPGDMTGGTARALASTGKIITSCGVIMAGTFGAMLFSPMNQLVQIGFATVVGLLLDTFIVRCMVVPAIAVKVGELNWWPGRKVKILPVEKEESKSAAV